MKILTYLFAVTLLLLLTNSQPFTYGVHKPQGSLSVDYLYSNIGTWKKMSPVEYKWNEYDPDHAPNTHPYDPEALVQYADGTHFTVCLDADHHLLLDYNQEREINVTEGGFAFHQHNGRGAENKEITKPFTNFLFADNQLASILSSAYGKEGPDGLSNYTDFARWKILTGNQTDWKPYGGNDYLDLVALDGLYYIVTNDKSSASMHFSRCLSIAKATYNNWLLQHSYTISENYKLGLLAIFASFMYESYGDQIYLQHYVSLRSNLLSRLQTDPSNSSIVYSWLVLDHANGSNPNLFHTQPMVLGSLGLSAGATSIFQVNSYPCDPTYTTNTKTHVRLANSSISQPGYLVRDIQFQSQPKTNYVAEFFARGYLSNSTSIVLKLEVSSSSGTSTVVVRQGDLQLMEWVPFKVNFKGEDKWSFGVYWTGAATVDLSVVRVKKVPAAGELSSIGNMLRKQIEV